MANRHLSRSVVLQALFEWDFRGQHNRESTKIVETDAKEFAPGVSDVSFMEELMKGILSKKEELDDIIVKAAPEWPIDKISPIDRNVLRIGLYELLFSDREEVRQRSLSTKPSNWPRHLAAIRAADLSTAFWVRFTRNWASLAKTLSL